jgi:transposase InsO family protein
MRIVNVLAPGSITVGRRIADISREANKRLKWFDYYVKVGRNARKTCRHFGISPDTFYYWKRRYCPDNLTTLEERSRRPKRARQPTWTTGTAQAVLVLREQYPSWGKAKLTRLLGDHGIKVSVSMVGRILKALKERGVLKELVRNHISARKRSQNRPYAVRKPKEYVARVPGDIVQVDTMDVRPLPDVVIKHFDARDVVSRWDVIEASSRATAWSAARFMMAIINRMPFEVKAIQVDGGSEFQSIFEETCQRMGICLFVLPPRSPKLNGHVERANRTHTEEFYKVTDSDFDIMPINQALLNWEMIYNTIRPHQSLNYLTPHKYLLLNYSIDGKEKVYGIY